MEHKPIERIRQALAAGPQAWLTKGTKDGKAKLNLGECATNPAYVKTHHAWLWQTLYAVDHDDLSSLLSRLDELEKALSAAQPALRYYTDAQAPNETCGGGYYSMVEDGYVAKNALAAIDSAIAKGA